MTSSIAPTNFGKYYVPMGYTNRKLWGKVIYHFLNM